MRHPTVGKPRRHTVDVRPNNTPFFIARDAFLLQPKVHRFVFLALSSITDIMGSWQLRHLRAGCLFLQAAALVGSLMPQRLTFFDTTKRRQLVPLL